MINLNDNLKKKCTKCGEYKPLEQYFRDKTKKDGLDYQCKACVADRRKKHRLKNLKTFKEKARIAAQKHRDKHKKEIHTVVLPPNTKVCTTCRELKNFKCFHKHKNSPDKHSYTCKSCAKKRRRTHYEKNKVQQLEVNARWKENNLERYREMQRKNHQKRRQDKKYIERRKKTSQTYKKHKLKTDSLYRFADNVRSLIRGGFRKKGLSKNKKSEDILGSTFSQVYTLLLLEAIEFYGHIPKNIHIDHKEPISAANSEREVLELNHWSNLQILSKEDNLRKSNTDYQTWLQSLPKDKLEIKTLQDKLRKVIIDKGYLQNDLD